MLLTLQSHSLACSLDRRACYQPDGVLPTLLDFFDILLYSSIHIISSTLLCSPLPLLYCTFCVLLCRTYFSIPYHHDPRDMLHYTTILPSLSYTILCRFSLLVSCTNLHYPIICFAVRYSAPLRATTSSPRRHIELLPGSAFCCPRGEGVASTNSIVRSWCPL